MTSNANEPAFPHPVEDYDGFLVRGLTKRELFAAMAHIDSNDIADMVASMFRVLEGSFQQRHAAEAVLRVRKADALLAELEKPK